MTPEREAETLPRGTLGREMADISDAIVNTYATIPLIGPHLARRARRRIQKARAKEREALAEWLFAPDEDPDEALAMVLNEIMEGDWLTIDLARAAREHIDRNSPPDVTPLLERECEQQRVRAEKAEADLARRGELLAWAQEDRDEANRRYAALRADVEREYAESPDYPTARILDADDKRGSDA